MLTLSILSAVAIIILLVLRSIRGSRQQWLQQVNLPGIWELEDEEAETEVLEFFGELDHGSFRTKKGNKAKMGSWYLSPKSLFLVEENDTDHEYVLRYFPEGRIGLDGPDRPRQIFSKRGAKIISLHGRS